MADASPKSNTLLYLALAAGGAYLLLKSNGSAAAPVPTTAATAGNWTNAAQTPASTPAITADILTIATQNGVDPATALAVVQYDAQYYDHSEDLSKQYFLANTATFAAALANYQGRDSSVATIATQNGVDTATAQAVIQHDAQQYGHSAALSVRYFLENKATFVAALASYQGQNGSANSSGTVPAVAPAVAPTSASTAASGSTSTGSATSTTRPGYPLDGEPDIRFASATKLANCNNPGNIFTTEYGDGSRNVRVNMARALGAAYHIFVEEIDAAVGYRFAQGGFNSWDDMYWSFINDPGSFAAVLTAYNNDNSFRPIQPRW